MRGTVRGERGQAAPLLLIVMLVAVLGCLLVASVGRAANRNARARTAADAAALAGAAAGRSAADAVASANGATVVAYGERPDRVEVTVELVGDDHVRATSSAAGALGTTGRSPPGGGDRRGLSPALRAALARADQLLGHPVGVMESLGPHEVLVPAAAAPELEAVTRVTGLCIVSPESNPVHFGLCPPRTSRH